MFILLLYDTILCLFDILAVQSSYNHPNRSKLWGKKHAQLRGDGISPSNMDGLRFQVNTPSNNYINNQSIGWKHS